MSNMDLGRVERELNHLLTCENTRSKTESRIRQAHFNELADKLANYGINATDTTFFFSVALGRRYVVNTTKVTMTLQKRVKRVLQRSGLKAIRDYTAYHGTRYYVAGTEPEGFSGTPVKLVACPIAQ
jgi:hypothetical protein